MYGSSVKSLDGDEVSGNSDECEGMVKPEETCLLESKNSDTTKGLNNDSSESFNQDINDKNQLKVVNLLEECRETDLNDVETQQNDSGVVIDVSNKSVTCEDDLNSVPFDSGDKQTKL